MCRAGSVTARLLGYAGRTPGSFAELLARIGIGEGVRHRLGGESGRRSSSAGRPRVRSTVELGGDDVQAPQDRHDVGDQVVLDDVREDLEVDERRRPGPGPPGGLAAVGDQVVAQLAVGAFDRRVDLVLGATRTRGWA